MTSTENKNDFKEMLLKQYGPLIGGSELSNILGYKASTTFNRARRLKLIELHIFNLPNRRGSFALTTDVAEWLMKISQKGDEQ